MLHRMGLKGIALRFARLWKNHDKGERTTKRTDPYAKPKSFLFKVKNDFIKGGAYSVKRNFETINSVSMTLIIETIVGACVWLTPSSI